MFDGGREAGENAWAYAFRCGGGGCRVGECAAGGILTRGGAEDEAKRKAVAARLKTAEEALARAQRQSRKNGGH